jgi:pimeloyl-ACP methyl ester carboxylesterase
MTSDPVVILGGFFATPRDYWEMRPALEKLSRAPVSIVPATRFDWALSLTGFGWSRILKKLDRTVRRTLVETGAAKAVLVGHSSGGIIGRLYLSPRPFRGRVYAGRDVVSCLVMLGSPHVNRRGSFMRRWVERKYPGAYFIPDVQYVAVAGKALLGDRNGSREERAAFRGYRHLCGRGDVWGDATVPLASAILEGALPVVLDGVFHSPRRGRRWYGNTRTVRRWWDAAPPSLADEKKAGGVGDKQLDPFLTKS